MTKGLKVWLWIILVLNGVAVLGNVASILINPIAIIYVALNVVVIVGLILLLFSQKRIGLYIYVGCAVIGAIFNVGILHASIIQSLIMAVIAPGITYLLMRNTWDEFK